MSALYQQIAVFAQDRTLDKSTLSFPAGLAISHGYLGQRIGSARVALEIKPISAKSFQDGQGFLEWWDNSGGTVGPTTGYIAIIGPRIQLLIFPGLFAIGEIVVNTANLQIAVGDADPSTPGTPLPLLSIRFWTIRAQYLGGEFVLYGSKIYQALGGHRTRRSF